MVATRKNKSIEPKYKTGTFIREFLIPFGKTSQNQKDKRRDRATEDFKFFAQKYFPHHLKEKPSSMHEEMFLRYQRQINNSEISGKGGKEALAAPRGNAKSTLSTLILPLWCIAAAKKNLSLLFLIPPNKLKSFLMVLNLNWKLMRD